mmetsp:Transcript_6883/g.13908  ORF Transcript_6883/g.13908 Transcript_6883/m.13908 type:complete len:317 (-) Transcript_6883:469-1419(-)
MRRRRTMRLLELYRDALGSNPLSDHAFFLGPQVVVVTIAHIQMIVITFEFSFRLRSHRRRRRLGPIFSSVVVVVVEQDLALERAAITHHRDAIKRHDATPHRDRGISVPLLRPSASKRQTPTEIPPQDVVAPHHQMGETTVLYVVERIQKHDDPFTRQERPQRRGHEFGFGGRVERGGEFFEKCGGRRRGGGSGRGGGGRGRDRRGRGRSRRMDVGVGRRRVDRRRWRRGTPSEGRRPVMMIFPMQHLLPLLIGNDGWLPWHVARPSGMLTVTRGSGSRRGGPRDGPAVEHRGLGVLHGALDGRRGARGEGCEVGR